jgi:hypothetical protein
VRDKSLFFFFFFVPPLSAGWQNVFVHLYWIDKLPRQSRQG